MHINIKATNITLSPAIQDYVEKRLEKIEKLLESDPSTKWDIELARVSNHHKKGDVYKAEIHIIGREKNHYASAENEDLYSCIDLARDEIFREVTSGKERRSSLIRRGGAKIKNIVKGFWSK
jgi:ribosomal subunit interface protein